MNYYNPYFYAFPNNLANTTKSGIFSRLLGKNITFSGILNNTQKVLSFANQAIPLVKQVKPLIGNAKTMFKLMNEFKKVEKPNLNITKSKSNNNSYKSVNSNNYYNNNGPQFFI